MLSQHVLLVMVGIAESAVAADEVSRFGPCGGHCEED
jgi:hypothetical protein